MTEVENLVLEQLRRIRGTVDRIELDVTDLKVRMSSMEQHQGQILTLLGSLSQRMDRLDERMGRVERRLDLVNV
jgi:ACT domain-containing protein